MSKGFSHSRLHRMAVLVDDGSNPFELACMTEVFGINRPEVGGLLYDLAFCSRRRAVHMRQNFFTMTGIHDLSLLDAADSVIVPNRPDTTSPHHPDVLEAIARVHTRGTRLIGMCSGAFTLAEAGILTGRRATVHWQWAPEFRQQFPDVQLDENVLFIDDDDILTSAGSAAALDLALHVVRRDHGADIAASVARRLVFAGHRPGGQRQFIEHPTPSPAATPLAIMMQWAQQHATKHVTVADLARQAHVSTATLHRRFRAETGTTPHEWLTVQRLEHARRLLETTNLTIEEISASSGLGTSANLRQLLRRATGLTPTNYRIQFGANR